MGLLIALTGIFLISFGGDKDLQLNPMGDLLAVIAAMIWAAFSTITKRSVGLDINTIQTLQGGRFYGLIFMVPALFLMISILNLCSLPVLKTF